ncbi:hypothetical protein ONS95_007513 [Cadophora gregata]|uniref:uncharacterized protein n=1 Tax=Cadophora gregata TaxID=51156 RepID=UPI0026DA7F36|nr:uncharacterized protein ONS95_007513 [Cadophora gregata]KAK0118629.1 hypothetical protein ONS96_011720 [Cadophora gregata f. sp. sojae]KAK0125888.1 hypothetical protein ONS95_007513 [Cadophora gregata]
MQMPPTSVIISWPRPNYKDPVTTGPATVITTCIFYPMVCIIIGLRCYTRLRISRSFGWDDWLILTAMVPTTAFMIICLVAEWHFHWNRHIWDVRPDTIVSGLKVVLTTQILFSAATTLTKLSMLVLVYRIVTESSKKLPKIIVGVMILISLECVAFIFGVMFQCGKPSRYWTLSFIPQHECMSETKNLLAAGIINTVSDLVIVVLPIPIIWRLQLPIQQQIIIVLLFGAGVLVTVASILRTYYLYQVTDGWDKTWHASPAWVTSSVELYVGIMCASIPATKKFFSRFSPRLFGASTPPPEQSHARPSARNSAATNHDVELGAYSGHPFSDHKEETTFEAFPAPPKYSHAINLGSYIAGRPHTAKSVKSVGSDGRDDVTRVDSDDELVGRYHHSPPPD